LVEVLGRGGSGQVWSARSPEGPVAVKVLRPEYCEDPEIVERFVGERSLLTGLRSPHIVAVRDLVIEGDRLGFVMDLVTGGDLRSRLREVKTLPPGEALDTMAQVLEGLAAVHAAGVVHRDLKPENILLGVDDGPGHVRVADFGIARLASTTRTTRTTGLVGTPRYVAPELAIRGQVSPAVDVYAAGITLYEVLFGRVPFDGPHPAAVLRAQAEDPPLRPDGVPDPLWDAIAAMLEKNPNDRPTAAQAAARLRDLHASFAALPAFASLPPSLRSDTDDTSTTDPHDNATDATGIGRRRARPSTGSPAPAAHRTRTRLVAATVITLVVALVVGGVVLFQHDDTSPAVLPFRVHDSSQGALDVVHQWSFASKRGDTINGTMTVNPTKSRSIPTTTTALAIFPSALSHVRFDPRHPIQHLASAGPGKSISSDGISVAQFTIPKGSTTTSFRYQITVPAGSTSRDRLDEWADQLRTDADTLCTTADPPAVCGKTDHLVTLEFTNPTPPPITVGSPFPAATLLQGHTQHGTTIPANKLHGITWQSTNPAAAPIDATTGTVTATTPGTTQITATIGTITTTPPLTITITGPTTTPPGPDTTTTTTKSIGSTTTSSTAPPVSITLQPPPTAVPIGIQGDLNSDGKVGCIDLGILLDHYPSTDPSADVNGDGVVNITDLSILLSHFDGDGTTWTRPNGSQCPGYSG
jgi:serine/threonine protein kinase